MKTALILTTINVPTVLALYRRLDPSVRFFVACDEKTPKAAYDFCASIPDCEVYSPERQKVLGWECSPLIGWETIARRNIALLEALKWGADLIVSIDDDNIAMDWRYFDDFVGLFEHNEPFRKRNGLLVPMATGSHPGVPVAFSGLKVSGIGWFDPGQLQFPLSGAPVCQRGFPQQLPSCLSFEPVVDARIGVAQGAVLGDPDTSAVDRISRHPAVHQVSEVLRAGVVSDPRATWAPLNAQNIAFLRELAPCFLMVPQWQRYDDIWAGLIAQRIMREQGLVVYYGRPFVFQQRNAHNLVKDLKAEIFGMQHTLEFANWLNILTFSNSSVLEMVKVLWNMAGSVCPQWVDPHTITLSEAWCADCERAMS
jgi:hypothetical protein